MHTVPLGIKHNTIRVPTAVCRFPPTFQRDNSFSSAGKIKACSLGRNLIDKHRKECFNSHTDYNISGAVTELCDVQSATVRRFSEEKKECFLSHMPQAIRTNGLSSDSCSLRQIVHERVSTLGSVSGTGPLRHSRWRVRVTSEAVLALRQWRHPTFLVQGVPIGVVRVRQVVTTDASLTSWGGIHEGRIVNGRWGQHLTNLHINYLEMLAVFLTLKHFLPFLKGHHVLVRTDNTTVVAYINRQGALRSLPLHMLARKLILWSNANLLSLRATHVQGVMNKGADLLSRGNPLYGEWKLNWEVVEQIWGIYGRVTVDLFASHDNAQCPLFFSLKDQSTPLGIDALAHEWPRTLLYAFPPITFISPTLYRVREEGLQLILIAQRWPGKYWLAEIMHILYEDPWSLPLRRDLLSQAEGEIFHPHPERLALWAWPGSGSI